MTPQERHDMFAAGLALILPGEVPHQNRVDGQNLTPEVLHAARLGNYASCGPHGSGWPFYFTADVYCGHLLPAVIELWRACYHDGQPAHTNNQPTETTT